ncbi:pilus assembly protein TadD [Rhizobiales bacterium L72]|uniref:Pilus assembly protein TadD n=1 Tax=Propylenella binzhouense TaxID=2555902 RepID=A0A964WU28_9HYPH|nr:pilus assembly protein TadD [Propylenella binzhouense]
MPSKPNSRGGRAARSFALGAIAAVALAGCQSTGRGPATTGSLRPTGTLVTSDLSQQNALAAVQTWGAAYGKNEKDQRAALNYAAALRAAGQTSQAVAVMRKAVILHPSDRTVLAAFGKALAEDGQFREALSVVQRAQQRDHPDWQLLATEGAILDSLGDNNGARERYSQALVLAPGEPQVLNNLAMSYVLGRDLQKAEATLRQALASPKATTRVRQNLALVLTLQGKGSEAQAFVSGGSPSGQAGANMDYLQGMVAQPNTWADLKKES